MNSKILSLFSNSSKSFYMFECGVGIGGTMGLLSFLKKKKRVSLDLPPPPFVAKAVEPDIPAIRVSESSELPDLPKFPELPSEPVEDVHEEVSEPVREPLLLEQPPVPSVQRPASELFVSVDDYRAVMQNASAVRAKLMQTESALKQLAEIHEEGERVLEKWARELSDVERKLSRVDAEIAKAQL